MIMPRRIQLSRKRGWKMPSNAVKVDHSTLYGNPFRVGFEASDNTHAKRLHRDWIMLPENVHLRAEIKSKLCGRDLGCWCPASADCHADTLLEVANK
jgi:hypothetical protein